MNVSFLKMFFQSFVIMAVGLVTLQAAPEDSKDTDKGGATPEQLAPYLIKGKPVMAEVGAIVPPKEINKYIAKVQAAAQEDPVWHKEFSSKAKPGLPLPWNEKLGLSKDEYEEYLKFWDQRQFKASQQVLIRLEEIKAGEWMIRVSGVGMPISLLRYYPETDMIKSTNGELKRIEDINADERSILGAWQGKEWRFEEKTEYVWTKENLAIGKSKDGQYCFLIYRIQESVTAYDKSLVIRFAAPKK
jgi:hypothetical protein